MNGMEIIRRAQAIGVTFSRATDGTVVVHGPASPALRELARDSRYFSREILDEKGLAQYFGHGLGHGLGRAVHDYGGMGPNSKDVIEPGQVWTVEPGV